MKKKKLTTLLLKTASNAIVGIVFELFTIAQGLFLVIYPFSVLDKILPLNAVYVIIYICVFIVFFHMVFYLEKNKKPWMPYETGDNKIVPQDEDEY